MGKTVFQNNLVNRGLTNLLAGTVVQWPAWVHCYTVLGRQTSNSIEYVAVSKLHVIDSTSAEFHYKEIGIVFQMKAED